MKIPTLETERLILRAPTMEDVEWFFSLRSDEEFMKYMHRPVIKEMSEAQAFVQNFLDRAESETGLQWVLEEKASGQPVGYAGPWRWDSKNNTGELGYGLDLNHVGKGFMREAVAACIKYGFEHMNLERIEAWMEDENRGSRKVVEANGMQREATLRHYVLHDGKYRNLYIYSILRNEYV